MSKYVAAYIVGILCSILADINNINTTLGFVFSFLIAVLAGWAQSDFNNGKEK